MKRMEKYNLNTDVVVEPSDSAEFNIQQAFSMLLDENKKVGVKNDNDNYNENMYEEQRIKLE